MVALLLSSSPSGARRWARSIPLFAPALEPQPEARPSSACFLVIVGGTPLAWWLARTPSKLARVVEPLVDLPIVMPPAVVGIALLQTFGRSGLLGGRPARPWI